MFVFNRKVPTLRLAISKRDDSHLWFYEMEKEKIDFKVNKVFFIY